MSVCPFVCLCFLCFFLIYLFVFTHLFSQFCSCFFSTLYFVLIGTMIAWVNGKPRTQIASEFCKRFVFFKVPGLTTAKGLSFALQANDPHTMDFTLAILRLHEKHFIDAIRRKWWETSNRCPEEEKTSMKITLTSFSIHCMSLKQPKAFSRRLPSSMQASPIQTLLFRVYLFHTTF